MLRTSFHTLLSHRCVVSITGEDRVAFLQSLVSNDVTAASKSEAVYALLLTPQGRFLHDLFLFEGAADTFLVDIERDRQDDFLRRLSLYKLRSRVTWQVMDQVIVAVVGDSPWPTLTPPVQAFPDPRHPALGKRVYIPAEHITSVQEQLRQAGFQEAPLKGHDDCRARYNIPDGSRDMMPEKALPLDYGLDQLNAISWTKGCYVGQEVTARMHYRRSKG